MSNEPLRIKRNQLERFLGEDVDAIRQFELLFDLVRGERATNPDGSYVVLSSGIQMCWLFASVGTAPLDTQPSGVGTFRWTFPAEFSSAPDFVIGGAGQPLASAGGRVVVIDPATVTATSADGYRHAEGSGSVNGDVYLIAIGDAA